MRIFLREQIFKRIAPRFPLEAYGMNPLRPREPRLKLGAKVYKELRNQVLARDGWRCQSCGSAKNLQVRHLRARSKLGDAA